MLGDLAETGESAWRGLLGVLGLVIRREATAFEKLASLAGRVRIVDAGQFLPDGILAHCELVVSKLDARGSRHAGAHLRFLANRMVVDWWFCGGLALAPDALDEYPGHLFALLVLFGAISPVFAAADLSASVFGACDLGSLARCAEGEDRMRTSFLLAALAAATLAAAESRIVDREITSAKFADNKIGVSAIRKLVVYLPAGYDESSQRYPVIYFLPTPFENLSCPIQPTPRSSPLRPGN